MRIDNRNEDDPQVVGPIRLPYNVAATQRADVTEGLTFASIRLDDAGRLTVILADRAAVECHVDYSSHRGMPCATCSPRKASRSVTPRHMTGPAPCDSARSWREPAVGETALSIGAFRSLAQSAGLRSAGATNR